MIFGVKILIYKLSKRVKLLESCRLEYNLLYGVLITE